MVKEPCADEKERCASGKTGQRMREKEEGASWTFDGLCEEADETHEEPPSG